MPTGSVNVDKSDSAIAPQGRKEGKKRSGRESRAQKARAARKAVLMEQPLPAIINGLRCHGSKPSDDGASAALAVSLSPDRSSHFGFG